jgi:predicted MFS family arabinose efflux permease
MPTAAAAVLYMIFCLLIAFCGTQRRAGFLLTFILSVIFTPVLVALVLLFTGPASDDKRDAASGGN